MEFVFEDPPVRDVDAKRKTLTELTKHPGRWALVSDSEPYEKGQLWKTATRRIKAPGEFTVRQRTVAPGRLSIYVRYDE